MLRVLACFALGLGVSLAAGCGNKPQASSTENKGKPGGGGDGHDHGEHTGGETDATLPGGKKCHAVLSAHFSKKGEKALEVRFEDFAKPPAAVTLPENTKVSLRVQRGEEFKTVELKPGPKDERKTDPAGQCSRFEGDADWLKPDDKFASVTLTIEGADKKPVWTDFEVKKYTHSHDE